MFKNYQKCWCTQNQEQHLQFALCLAIYLHIKLIHVEDS